MVLALSLVECKILNPNDKELVMSKPDKIEFYTKKIKNAPNKSKASKHKSSKIKLDSRKTKKRSTKKLHKHNAPRKLYEKYDPKKYIRRYDTYQKRVNNAKHHILGNRKIALSKNLKDIELKKKLHERMMHRMSKKPNRFKVNLKEFRKRHPHHYHKKPSRHLTKVVGDDSQEMNELHTNEDDDHGEKLESIPLLLVGDYEIVIEKK